MGFDGKVVGRRQRVLRKLSYSRSTEREQFPQAPNPSRLQSIGSRLKPRSKRAGVLRPGLKQAAAKIRAFSRELCSFTQRIPLALSHSEAAAHKASGVLEQSLKWSP